ncbi:hypothetical protein ACIBMX_03065 [Streptomyces phaeochromogenes]|uniref:hypothetical protein n=1 Tax=Streptomyces phaeochromogenes TaxID=1923 RepID=UPI0033EFADFF
MREFGIRILALQLRGYRKNYLVNFSDGNGNPNPLSIIAGQITTGKTTIFEFIDYCLGASKHPEHIEIVEGVQTARLAIMAYEPMLEGEDESDEPETSIEEGSDAARWGFRETRYVLERSIEGNANSVRVFNGGLEDASGFPRVLSADISAEENISKFLLQLCGLDGIRLRQAPTKADSATHALSFRDLVPLWFLTNTRLDNKNLTLEHHPFKANKLRQVVDLMFDIYDEVGSALGEQINQLRAELAEERAGSKALWAFLRDQGITGPLQLEERDQECDTAVQRARRELGQLDAQAGDRTAFASQLREEYLMRSQQAREAGARLRDRETLLRRLIPLRAQYSDDVRKLTMLVEARRLFDPLSVAVCPVCASELNPPASIEGDRCSLCKSHIPDLIHHSHNRSMRPGESDGQESDGNSVQDIDVSKELRSTQRRLNELKEYIEKVDTEIRHARKVSSESDALTLSLQRQLDSVTHDAVTPLLAERDRVARAVSDAEAAKKSVEQQRAMLQSVEAKAQHVELLTGRLSEANKRLRELQDNQRGKDDLLNSLSERFGEILTDFRFPKLSDAEIDRQLIPHVRKLRYDRVGSSGALTLLALAWELTLFELAYEEDGRHPGFLLIDSPQKNLAPEGRKSGDSEISDSVAGVIVNKVYAHLRNWLSNAGEGAQVIVIDNVPPAAVEDFVCVRFSGDPEKPPYGLIDDATSA